MFNKWYKNIFIPLQKRSRFFLRSIRKQNGQSFIEFMLLLFVLISMSLLLLTGSGKAVGGRWRAIIGYISASNLDRPEPPELL